MGRWLVEDYGTGHSNRRTFEIADPDALADLQLSSPTKTLARGAFAQDIPDRIYTAYVEMYERVNAGF